uniref:Uncharacterized protein n=1 Tax=Haemonchus contortus TaxID=6289 RepID=A0A7I4Z4V2_HAECO
MVAASSLKRQQKDGLTCPRMGNGSRRQTNTRSTAGEMVRLTHGSSERKECFSRVPRASTNHRTTPAREGMNGDVTGACSRKSTTNGMTGDSGDVYMYIRMEYMYIYAYMYTVALKSLR